MKIKQTRNCQTDASTNLTGGLRGNGTVVGIDFRGILRVGKENFTNFTPLPERKLTFYRVNINCSILSIYEIT